MVDIEPVGDGRGTVKYLAPYVNRVAISNNRIVACDRSSVTFRYKPSKKKYFKERKVTGVEFVRRVRPAHSCRRGFRRRFGITAG